MELEKIMTVGTQLGLKDAELRGFANSEQNRLREERVAEREASKANQERKHANLLLKLRLQKEGRSNPQGEGSASTSQAAS